MELESKQHAVAKLIDGEAIDDGDRVAVCIKGSVNGFPARLEAFTTHWPFGVSYIVQTREIENTGDEAEAGSKITLIPRMGRGFWSLFSQIFLFESKGMSVNDKQLEKKLIFSYDNREEALRIVKYPGIPEILLTLEDDCRLKEMIIRSRAGIFFSQGVSFKDLDLDLANATFRYLGQIVQVMSQIF